MSRYDVRTLARIAVGVVGLVVLVSVFSPLQIVVMALVVAAIVGVWRLPAVTAGIALFIAALYGSWMIVAAAPVAMLLAAREAHLHGVPVTGRSGQRPIWAALGAFVLTLPFVGLSMRRTFDGRGAEPLPDWLDWLNLPDWLSFSFGDGDEGAQLLPPPDAPSRPQPTEPNEPFDFTPDWPLIIAIVLIVVALVLLGLWWRRRRQVELGMPAAGWSLARLEDIGAAVGRERRPHEGPIAYATALSDHTGDQRIDAAGPLISAGLYESATADDTETDASLRTLEAEPPTKPPRSWRDRLAVIGELRHHLLVVVAVIAVGIAIWLLTTSGDDLREPPPADPGSTAMVDEPYRDA